MAGLYRINETMELELTKVIKDVTGAVEVMWDKQDAFVDDAAGVKPALKDFVNLAIVSGPNEITKLSYLPVIGQVGLFDITQQFKFTLSATIYTNNAHLHKIARLVTLLRSEAYKNRLKSVGLGFWESSNPSDLSELDQTRYNLRSHIDLIFSYISLESNVNIGEIERFQATGLLGDIPVSIDVDKNGGIL